jgi:hypothetical protein
VSATGSGVEGIRCAFPGGGETLFYRAVGVDAINRIAPVEDMVADGVISKAVGLLRYCFGAVARGQREIFVFVVGMDSQGRLLKDKQKHGQQKKAFFSVHGENLYRYAYRKDAISRK